MAHISAFAIGGVNVQLTDDSYSETYSSVEYTAQTEAGTTRRDTVRTGFLSELSISITADDTTKAKFDDAVAEDSLVLTLYDSTSGTSKTWDCYISSYSASLIRDTDDNVFWSVSATFNDLEG